MTHAQSVCATTSLYSLKLLLYFDILKYYTLK